MRLFLAIAFLGANLSETAFAQEQAWTMTGSLRARVEAIDGHARVGVNAADTIWSSRLRLEATGPLGVGWTGQAELYDSRAWGGDTGSPLSANDVNTLELVQANIKRRWDAPFGKGSFASVQFGRMTLNLGSRRLVAADDYRNTTNGYTGVRSDLHWASGVDLVAIAVVPQIRLPEAKAEILANRAEPDLEITAQRLYGGIVTWPIPKYRLASQVTLMRFEEEDRPSRPTRDRDLTTYGLRLFAEPKPGHFDQDLEAYVQHGTNSASSQQNALRHDVNAFYVRAEWGYQWKSDWKPRLSFEFDWASGDELGGEDTRFDTLFGMRRAEISPAGILAAVGRANIASPGFRLELEPARQIDAFVAWRSLWLAEKTDAFAITGVVDRSGNAGSYAGQQFDARLRWWLLPHKLRLEINGVYIAKGSFLKEAPNAPSGRNTRYVGVDLVRSF
jgi:hypothetical protein